MNPLKNLWHLAVAIYEGVRHSLGRSYIPGSVQSARFDATKATRMELVRKSQYFEKNNAIYNRLADLFESYTVGCGLQLSPASSAPDWNKKAKEWLSEWSMDCDIASRQCFSTLQSLMARKWFVDGEVFIRLVYGDRNIPKLQLVEAHMVGTPPTLSHREGVDIIDGVLIDPRTGIPIGYFIATENSKGEKIWGNPTPAAFVEHLFEPSRPGQYRGLPFVSPVINDLHDLDDLHILEMKAAKDHSRITNVIKTKTGEMPSAANLLKSQFQQAGQISTGATVNETRTAFYKGSVGADTILLHKGDEMDQHKSERPSVATQAYWKYKTELVCNGIGIPYIMVFPDSMQGTVYRGALDMAAVFFQARSSVIANVLSRIYRNHVMDWARYGVPTLRDAPGNWKNVSIRSPRAANVDVGRNSTAMLAQLEAGATNYEQIYAPLGLDWRDEFLKLKEQQEFAREIGLVFGDQSKNSEAATAVPIKQAV